MLKPLFKYPGGKYDEYSNFSSMIPEKILNYHEPFAGSAGVFLRLKNEGRITGDSYLNDISVDLINFYSSLSNPDLGNELNKLNSARNVMSVLSSTISSEFGDVFVKKISGEDIEFPNEALKQRIDEIISRDEVMSSINTGGTNISEFIYKSISDKAKRFSNKEITSNKEDIAFIQLSTAIHQGFYFFVRNMYNDWLNHDTNKYSDTEKASHWFFIREMCYGSMFRFSKEGKFNIPYGGFTYNKKDITKKIDAILSKEVRDAFSEGTHLSSLDFREAMNVDFHEDDFMFLDPPYDTTFSEYDRSSFGRKEHTDLRDVLKNVKCKWMLVIKNTEFIYGLYKDWANISSFDKTYQYHTRGEYDKNVEHLIITNY